MHPTGSRTTKRFSTPWDLPKSGGRHRHQFLRACRALATIAALLPVAAAAQGPIPPAMFGPAGVEPFPPGAESYGPICYPDGVAGPGHFGNTTYELLPDDRFPHHGRAHWSAFAHALQYTYFRVEYLNWNIDDPGVQLVGAPRASGGEDGLFPAIDPLSQVNLGSARLTSLDAVGFHRNNGVRGVLGIPTRIGTFEAGIAALEQSGVHLTDEPFFDFISDTQVTPVVTLLNNGVRNDNVMILFNQGLNVQLQAEFFTTELNFIMNPLTPHQPLQIRPLWGFQYARFWNEMDIFGTDIDTNDPTNPDDDVVLDHRIRSEIKNNVFAPQIGVRVEFVHEYFTVGVTPKFMLGFNRHRDEVLTEEIFTPDEGRMVSRDEFSEFSPGLDLSVYGRVHLGKHFSLFVSYQLYIIDNLAQAPDNVLYDTVNGTVPNIRLSRHEEGMFFDGVTVGGEFRFH